MLSFNSRVEDSLDYALTTTHALMVKKVQQQSLVSKNKRHMKIKQMHYEERKLTLVSCDRMAELWCSWPAEQRPRLDVETWTFPGTRVE